MFQKIIDFATGKEFRDFLAEIDSDIEKKECALNEKIAYLESKQSELENDIAYKQAAIDYYKNVIDTLNRNSN